MSKLSVQILIDGYIREIGELLSPKIIPPEINQLCINFYYFAHIMILLNEITKSCHITIAHVSINENGEIYFQNSQTSIHRLYKTNDISYNIFNAGICKSNNIILPNNIQSQITNLTTKQSYYDIIFKCGGERGRDSFTNCNAFIFSHKILNISDNYKSG